MNRTLVCFFMLSVGCGTSPPGVLAPASVDPGDAPADTTPAWTSVSAAPECLALPSPADPTARLEGIAEALRLNGATRLSTSLGPDESFFFNPGLTADGALEDPAAAFASQLAELGVLARDEVEVSFKPGSFDDGVAIITRAHVAGRPARFWRPLATVNTQRQAGHWWTAALTLWPTVAFATAGDVEHLAACTVNRAPPPPESLADFHGYRFTACGMDGAYVYTPQETDTVAWARAQGRPDEIRWEVIGGRWRLVRPATYTIAPPNYWRDIGHADCICHDVAGYELLLDAVTGERLRYTPGINCVVC